MIQSFSRSYCVSCVVRQRLYSTVSSRLKEDRLKIEAEPPESETKNFVGPPDPISNIRPIKFHKHAEETITELHFRQQQEDTIQWNHDFWKKHNAKFFKEKEEFTAMIQHKTGAKPTAEELSMFYREFLDENRKVHLRYNREWYQKNISLLWPAVRVVMIKAARRLGFGSGS